MSIRGHGNSTFSAATEGQNATVIIGSQRKTIGTHLKVTYIYIYI